jgi:hypothetical protein
MSYPWYGQPVRSWRTGTWPLNFVFFPSNTFFLHRSPRTRLCDIRKTDAVKTIRLVPRPFDNDGRTEMIVILMLGVIY